MRFVQDVKVIMGVTAALLAQDAIIGILGGIARGTNAKGRALFHTAKDVIDPEAVLALPALEDRPDPIFLAQSFFGPGHRDSVIGREGFDPALVVIGALAQQLFGQQGMAPHLPEEVDHIALAGQKGQIAMDDHAIKAVIKPLQERSEEFKKELHRRFPSG
jgi:hypothetical protein